MRASQPHLPVLGATFQMDPALRTCLWLFLAVVLVAILLPVPAPADPERANPQEDMLDQAILPGVRDWRALFEAWEAEEAMAVGNEPVQPHPREYHGSPFLSLRIGG